MHKNGAALLYLFVIITVAAICPTVSFSYDQPKEEIIQYITNLSRDIYNSINILDRNIIYSSNGEIKLKVFLSPWGELKDVYVSESSGNKDLDNLCMKAIWVHDRYQPFPEEMGEKDLWVEVPIIFESTEQAQDILTLPSPVNRRWNNVTGGEGTGRGVNDAVDLALENHMAAKIAQDEMDLSRLKIREARRALYPAASLNYLETTGKTTGTTQSFTDKEYKLKFEYPLYYGWRLKYAVEQATSNMKASTFNYDKMLQDLKLEVETAFYSYIAARMNLKLHRSLLEEAGRILSIAKKRFEAGLSTKTEYMQLESQFKQINYQIVSSENEVTMTRLNLAQAMNIRDAEKIIDKIDKYQEKDLEPVDLDIALDDCVNLALKSRPDLKAKEYSLEANDYERKIVESKNQLRVDLTGTYGKSGGAYESETLALGPDWYLGVKVTKPFGGNTISTAMTKEKTSQKHGQSTRTDSLSKSVEMGLLNNLQQFSEEKSAEIGYKKAMDEVIQARDNVVKEINDTYLNYKKGLAQISSNLNKIKYREEELKIAKARVELNEISLSEFMQANMNFIDEKGYYIEALGSLYQSLAKLNKATGYVLFLDDENFKLANTK
ncbi:MAG: TolC family protein [Candidatus Omnitrophota bacterium]|nr:TolC family protein [Candidatus Omnitrophota bacterium]